MCMEDIRLGRQLAPAAKFVNVGNGPITQLCGSDPQRTRLIIGCNNGGALTVTPEGLTPASAAGFTLSSAYPFMVITVEEYGRLVTGPWFARGTAANYQVIVIEVSLEKQ